MTRRHYSAQGTRFVHEVHPGYRHASRNNGRWHKPTLLERVLGLREEGHAAGMVRNCYGIVLLIGVFVLSVFACAAWGV